MTLYSPRLGGEYKKTNKQTNKMAASSRFANVSDKEILEIKISAVPKSTQNATKYAVKLFKGK